MVLEEVILERNDCQELRRYALTYSPAHQALQLVHNAQERLVSSSGVLPQSERKGGHAERSVKQPEVSQETPVNSGRVCWSVH